MAPVRAGEEGERLGDALGGVGRIGARALPLLRLVIETRKDQLAAQNFAVRPRAGGVSDPALQARVAKALAFLARPDKRHAFGDWLRMLVEDMLVIDAATIYPRFERGGGLYSLDIVDGATIKPLIGEDGRAPAARPGLSADPRRAPRSSQFVLQPVFRS